MSIRDIAEKEEIIRWQEKLLKRSYTRNLQKKRMSELIGNAQHLHSLEISAVIIVIDQNWDDITIN